MSKNGIHINQKVISRISGPVSFHYLHPPPDRPDYPIVLLLGDKHGSFDMCPKCDDEENEENEEGVCEVVYDPKFLREIDRIAENYPVDFFTESTHEHPPFQYGDEAHVLFHHLYKNVRNCYDVSKRSTPGYLQECPTQFIRWHHSDIRHMYRKTVEGQLMLLYHHFANLDNRTGKSVYFETMSRLMLNLTSLVGIKDMSISLEYAFTITDILFRLFIEQIEEKKEEIEERNERETIRKTQMMIDFTFYLLERHNSILFKQIKKYNKDNKDKENKDIVWRNIILDSLLSNQGYVSAWNRFLNSFYDNIPLSMMFRDILKNTYRFDRPYYNAQEYGNPDVIKNIGYINDVISDMTYIFLVFTGTFLDIYTLARTFKMPDKNDRSVLMIGYFGKEHSITTSRILLTHLKYSRIFYVENEENKENKNKNCILINTPLYLEENVEALAKQRYSLYPERLQQYKDVIESEKTGRGNSLIGRKKDKKIEKGERKKRKSKSKGDRKGYRKSKGNRKKKSLRRRK